MTEETLDKIFAKHLGVTEFLDAQGNEWFIDDISIVDKSNDAVYVHKNCFPLVVIPGLRPMPKMKRVEVKRWMNVYADRAHRLWDTKEMANRNAAKDCIACVELIGEYFVEDRDGKV
jgi:hypothetical protein